MTTLKVFGLVTDAFGGRGGIAAVTRDMATAFSQIEICESVTLFPRNTPDPVLSLPAKVVQNKPTRDRLQYAFSTVRRVARARPNLIYSNHLFMAPLAAHLARIVGAKFILHLHGLEIWTRPSEPQRKALEASDIALCVSRDTRGHVLNYCQIAPERAVVLNNAVGDLFVPGDRDAARKKLQLGDEFAILTVGRIGLADRYKGHAEIIRAIPALRAHRKVVYLVAGEGGDRRYLQAIADELGVRSHVRFLGYVPDADIPDLYRAADLYAMPSRKEGFGVVFIEAMACGTPAIGISVGGVPDALAHGELGLCVSPAEFSTALLKAVIAPRALPDFDLARRVGSRFGFSQYSARVANLVSLALATTAT